MAIKDVDLSSASAIELAALQKKLGGMIQQKEAEELEGNLKQMDELAAKLGLSRQQVAAHF
jgi:hypothetical protein